MSQVVTVVVTLLYFWFFFIISLFFSMLSSHQSRRQLRHQLMTKRLNCGLFYIFALLYGLRFIIVLAFAFYLALSKL